ncbi:MAG: hypothetical protein methR_P2188 [Methyloprofundus sp.]|nr:MAG: hypothetical protein methR_P2188 [Methyloprofundus sp.]
MFIVGSNEVKQTEGYFVEYDKNSQGVLLSMIHENSYWNHSLYRSLFLMGSTIVLLIIMLSIFALLYLVPQLKNGVDYSILRVVFVFLSFTIIYEILDKITQYYESARIMLEIDNEIERNFMNAEMNLIYIFDLYIKTKEKTPSIPLLIYKFNRRRLNEGWKARVSFRCSD